MSSKETKLTNGEAVEIFGERAKAGAKSVCGSGKCSCIDCYKCGHTNRNDYQADRYGKEGKCPLEEYNVEPDTRTFMEKVKAGEKCVSCGEQLNMLFAICACCNHSGVTTDGKYYNLGRSDDDFSDYCIDCPVEKARENLEEGMAEVAMS